MIVIEVIASGLLVIGSFFVLVGSIGLAKLPDFMRRLHGPTKATTLGIGGMLVSSMIYFAAFESNPTVHELLIAIFLFLTAPVSAQMMAKAFMLRDRRVRDELPPTGVTSGWATLDPPPPRRGVLPKATTE